MNSERLTSFRRTLATNIHGRWSLSTRGSEHSFDESDNWSDVGLTMRQLTTREHPTTLPLFDNQLCLNSTESVDKREELTPKQIERDGVKRNQNGNRLLSYSSMAASHRWTDYDEDSDDDGNCIREKVYDSCHVRSMEDGCSNSQAQFQALENKSSHSWSPTMDTPQSEDKMNITEHIDVSSTARSPKTPRTKPPIKPRKKLPQSPNARPQTPNSPQKETMSPSSSAPSIHTPKAAPRKQLIRAVSVHSYDRIQPYQCVADVNQQVLDRVLWTPKNGETVPVTYYNIPVVASSNKMGDHTYEQVQRYEKIQTYETIPYHVELGFRNT